jgi:gliding motility-associated-like protein
MKKLIYLILLFAGSQASAQSLTCLTPTLVFTDPTTAGNPVITPTIGCDFAGYLRVNSNPALNAAPTAGNKPCLRFFTSLTNANSQTNNTVTLNENAATLSTNPTNLTLYTWYVYGLNPSVAHGYTLCNQSIAPNMQYTVTSCYDNVILNSGTWVNTSANGCQSFTIPANTNIGNASFSITPNAAAAIVTNNGNGYIDLDPNLMAPGTYSITYTFATGSCTTSATRTVLITNPYVGAGSSFSVPANMCPNGPCINLNSQLYPTAYGPGTWSGTGVSSNSFCPNSVGTGTYLITYSVGITPVCSATNSNVYYVAPQPTANAGPTRSLTCANNPTILTGSGGGTYAWSNATLGNNFSTSANPSVGFAGTYSLVVNNGTCSSSPATMQVVTNTTPPSLPSTSVSNIINCINTQATITATGAGITYVWSGPGIVSGGTSATPVVNVGGTYNYTITGTANGCTATSNQAVTQNTATVMNLSTSGAALNCTNNATSISGDQATYSYTWTAPASGTIVSGQSTQTLNILGTGVYTLVAMNPANGCIVTRTITPTTNTNVITPNIAVPPVITCSNPTVTLNGTPVAGVSYTWTGPSVVGSPNTANTQVSAGGVYTLSVTNSTNGCVGTKTAAVSTSTVPPSTPTINPASVVLACPAQTAAVTSTATGATSYTWFAPAGGSVLSGGATATAQVTSSSPGAFTVVTTGTNGCQSSGTVMVSPNTNAPTFTLSNPSPSITCASTTPSTTVNITSTVTIASYSWGPSGGISGPTNTASVTFTAAGSYTVVITATNGCISTGVVAVGSATTPPSVVAGTGTAQTLSCSNATVTITPSITPSSPNYTYTWSGPSIVGSATNSSVQVNGAGTYTLAITDTVTGCSSGAFTVAVTGNNTPPTVNATSSSTVGIGCSATTSTAQLTAISSGSVTYLWSNALTTSVITVSSAGVYTVTVTDPSTGCSNAATIAVNSSSTAPGFSAVAVGNFPCGVTNSTLQLGAASSSSNSISYSWSGGSIVSGSNTANPIINAGGIYTVVATDNITGCSSTATVAVFSPTVIANFTVDVSSGQAPLIVTFSNTSLGAANYTWTFGDGGTSTSTNPVYTYTTPGTYTVVLVSGNGICSDTHTMEIKVTGGLGTIPEIFTPNGDGKNDPFYIPGLDAYPNCTLQIYNRWGNMVYEAAPYKNDWDGTPNKSSMGKGKLPVGAYFYILDLGDDKEPERIRKGFVQLEY